MNTKHTARRRLAVLTAGLAALLALGGAAQAATGTSHHRSHGLKAAVEWPPPPGRGGIAATAEWPPPPGHGGIVRLDGADWPPPPRQ
jgi:hypothetical protein